MTLDYIRPWLLMEMNHCTLPKAIVEQFLHLFESDSEIVGVLNRMLSLYQVNQTKKKEPINALENMLSALTVDKPRSKRAESFCQDMDWLAKKPEFEFILSESSVVCVFDSSIHNEPVKLHPFCCFIPHPTPFFSINCYSLS